MTMHRTPRTARALALAWAIGIGLFVVASARSACEFGHQRQGCRIHVGLCVCGIGCSEYSYASKEECTKALNGQRRNECSGGPCLHGGSCSQILMDPGYKCRCEGTGYYGTRCQYACPTPDAMAPGRIFPYECVVI